MKYNKDRILRALEMMRYETFYNRSQATTIVSFRDDNGNIFETSATDFEIENTPGIMQRIIDDISRKIYRSNILTRLEMMGYIVIEKEDHDIVKLCMSSGRQFSTTFDRFEHSYNPYELEAVVSRINGLIMKDL